MTMMIIRLISIVSQPKKVVVVVIVVVVAVVIVVGLIVVLVVIIVSHRNLTLKFSLNWVSNTWDISFFSSFLITVVFVVGCCYYHCCSCDFCLPQKPSFKVWSKLGQ